MSRLSTVFALSLLLPACGATQADPTTTASDPTGDALKRKHKCLSNGDCAVTEFCDTEATASCTETGVCNSRGSNLFCAQIWIGVCGCDGKTYANDCLMHKAGVSQAHEGACQSACRSNDDCGTLEYCQFPLGQCGGDGACSSRGASLYCIEISDPVCGCNGVTYTNACFARKAGQPLSATGECD